ncbi:NAD(P)H-dependent oxidoreductase [Marinomonas arenicola]|uniref:NAD(P)H-dependent oxidoreductase n=1 Tax=Marinomonas arenicola TaxID=569601 RepID=A0ABU9G498_9GAMM
MKVLAFGASSSAQSINKTLATYAAGLIEGATVTVLDLNDFAMPLFSEDSEKEFGVPSEAQAFLDEIAEADLLVVSFAEHNGCYTAAYKNTFDWASRLVNKVYQNKPVIALSTSPGPGGAKSVLALALNNLPFFQANVLGSLSVPSFYDVMKDGDIVDDKLKQSLVALMAKASA